MTAQHIGSPARSRWWRRTAVAAIAVGGLALSACSGGGTEDTSGSGGGGGGTEDLGEMTVVSFLPLESFTFTPEMYAYAGGYFEDNGLDVTLQAVQGTAPAIQAIIGGAADITRVSTVDVMPGLEQGQPITAVGTMAYASNLRVVSSEDDPIEDTEDLEGKTIGLGSIGGTSEKQLNFALDAAGVDRDSVSRQAVPVTAATFELVRQGQLDGYVVSLDTSIAIANQNDDAVVSPAGLPDSPERQVWIASDNYLGDEANAEKVTAFLTAIEQATQAIIDDSDNDFENVLQTLRDSGDFTFAALDDDAIAVEALQTYTTQTWIDESGELSLLENDPETWGEIYDLYVDGGLLEGGADPEEWISSDYLPAS